MTKRDVVVQEAQSWLRTPYHHLGSVKGVDCAMLLVAVFKAVGLVPADLDPRPYAPDWHLHRGEERFLGWLELHADQVHHPLPGDVVVWRYGRTYSHGAIVVSQGGDLVHAYQDARCVVMGHLSESALSERRHQFWRVRGIEDLKVDP